MVSKVEVTPHLRDRLKPVLLLVAFWSVIWIVDAMKDVATQAVFGGEQSLGQLFWNPVPWWLAWLVLSPLALAFAKRLGPDRNGWLFSASGNLLGSAVFTVLHVALASVFFGIRNGTLGFEQSMAAFKLLFARFSLADMLTYWALVIGGYAVRFLHQNRERRLEVALLERQAAQLQARFAEARLDALRMELNPHFLFNALNSVSGLVRRRQTDAAVGMIAKLGQLLRLTLDSGDRPEIPLAEELELVQAYIDIERVRFGDRLEISVRCPESLRTALVPTLVLQPLVENAVKHGVSRREGSSAVEIQITSEGDQLVLRVKDVGCDTEDVSAKPSTGHGIGLSNTRARLEQLYGAGASVGFESHSEGSTSVVTLPLCRDRDENTDLVAS